MINKTFKIINDECSDLYSQSKFKFLKNKKILITGASGLIGQYLIGFFLHSLSKKYKPKKIVLITRSKLPNHLNFLKKNKYFEHRKINLSNITKLNMGKFDYIIHGATYAQPLKFTKNNIETILLNTAVTNELIKLMNKKSKFLFISSSELYSGLVKSKLKEEDIGNTNPSHFRSCYIDSKRCGEAIVNAYRKKGYDTKSARLCLAYGPGVKKDDNRVLNELIKKGMLNKKITISGGKNNIRAYIYITDAIRMLINILFFSKENLYNVGGNQKISILGLAKKIAKELKVPFINKKDKKINQGAPNHVQIDIGKYKKEFGNFKFTDIKKGLNKTIEWHNEIIKK
ncbi:NAD-dependent epimerase/dehydratase family protein [Candidatus Pelagibacter sp.]|jgi:UDP-glucuronate decarboxylase|nr:NAD-dependent epimerase/dehydratase family protein [Candidatus Pelagibacter sp.]